jgi:hypothetical protein
MRDFRDNKLLKRLGYVSEAAAYNGETDGPDARRYVSAIDDDGGAVYAVRKSGVPVLLVADDALSHYSRLGHAWPNALAARGVAWAPVRDIGLAFRLTDIRHVAPELLDQASGVALFNLHDALRLLSKYDALQQRKRAERAARRKGAR